MPSTLTRFYGRETELADLTRLVEENRLVTVVGGPGAGKTRLAVQFAAGREPVRFVGLAEVTDARGVPGTVAAALGVAEERSVPVAETLAAVLRDTGLLLVLDNCEHVLPAAAELLAVLLANCPRLHVLATSRAPTGVAGEQLFRLPPLGSDPAVLLFADRAGLLASPPVDVDDTAITRICARMDGLPLAIELAAAWCRVLSPTQILHRLDTVLPLLGGPDPERAPTMTAAVAWSYRLLAEDEQALFDRLSVFAGGFDLAAAEAVAGPGLLPRLAALVDHSLVLAERDGGSMRFRLLEPVRQCGAVTLAARGEESAVRMRHAEYYLRVARSGDAGLRGGRLVEHLADLRRDDANLQAALAWARGERPHLALRLATALTYYREHRGLVTDARADLTELLNEHDGDDRLRATALARLGRLAWRQQDYAYARENYTLSLQIAQELGDDLGVARGLRNLALVASVDGRPDEAADLAERSIALFRQHGDERGRGWALTVLAMARYQAGDVAAGRQSALAALDIAGGDALSMTAHLSASFGAAVDGETAEHRKHLTAAIADVPPGDLQWLWGAQALAESEGRVLASLRLAGAARAVSRRGNRVADPFDSFCDVALERARERVGVRAAKRLLAQGEQLDVERLVAEALARPTAADRPLSDRELQVAEHAADGLTNEQIAQRLFISRRTVETHVEHVRQKLDLGSRTEVVAWALARRMAESG